MNSDASGAMQTGWQADNARGLALAARADWAEAADAFAGAADHLARELPAQATAHEPLALVLGNLSQAYFRAGRIDDAIQQAQRACALRVALAGEDGMPVARARMDLAVMLAAAGRVDEAMVLVQRAIACIEHRVGDEDARLAIVLENAARIALAAAAPANAEPLLLRLHALLDAHGLSTARAEQLLARIAAVRTRQADEAMTGSGRETPEPPANHASIGELPTPAAVTPVSAVLAEVQRTMAEQAFVPERVAEVPATGDEFSAYLEASLLPDEDWEDQPLRDAVALTDVLLRTTPGGVPVIPEPASAEPEPAEALSATPSRVEPAFDDMALDLTDALDERAAQPQAASDEALPVDLDPAPHEPIDLNLAVELPADNGLVLDFAVEHGVIDTSFDEAPLPPPASGPVTDALVAPLLVAPAASQTAAGVSVADPLAAPAEPPSPIRRVDIAHAAPTTAPPVAPMADIVATAPPTAENGSTNAGASVGGVSRRTAQQPSIPERTDADGGKRSRAATAPDAGGASKLPFIIGGVLVAGGAAAWFLLR